MLVVFFDLKGIVHHECGQMVNKQLYQQVLARLRDAVRWKRPELWENQTWILPHDNAPGQASLLIRSYLAKHQISFVPHPPYSSDLAPSRLFLVSQTQNHLERTSFPNHRERFRKMRQHNCAPSQKVRSRKRSNNGRNVGNGASPGEGTVLKGTVLEML